MPRFSPRVYRRVIRLVSPAACAVFTAALVISPMLPQPSVRFIAGPKEKRDFPTGWKPIAYDKRNQIWTLAPLLDEKPHTLPE